MEGTLDKSKLSKEILEGLLFKVHFDSLKILIERLVSDDDSVADVVFIALDNKKFISDRAAWLLAHLAETKRELVAPFASSIIKKLPGLKITTQQGCLLRALKQVNIDLENDGDIIDICIHYIISPNHPPYHKAYAIDLLQNIVKQEPELKREFDMILHEYMEMLPSKYVQNKAMAFIKNKPNLNYS